MKRKQFSILFQGPRDKAEREPPPPRGPSKGTSVWIHAEGRSRRRRRVWVGGDVAEIGAAESEGGAAEKIRADVTVGIESDHRIASATQN